MVARVDSTLAVVTVTYSPGEHLENFLTSLAGATERPTRVIMADNGSTDGTPEAAAVAHPNVELLRTGGNIGYGGAVNRAVAEIESSVEFVVVANPDVRWEPGSLDALIEAAGRWPRAGSLGPLIHEPDGSIYPSARSVPTLVIRGRARASRHGVARESVDPAVPPGERGDQRTVRRLAVRVVPAAAPIRIRRHRRIRLALLHVHGRCRPGRPAGPRRVAQRLRSVGARDPRQGPRRRATSRTHASRTPRERVPVPGRPSSAPVAGAAEMGTAGRTARAIEACGRGRGA